MTDQQARQAGLNGSDVYIRSQLAYKDSLNRDAFVLHLNREAYRMFSSSIFISRYLELKAEFNSMQQAWESVINSGTFDNFSMPATPLVYLRTEFMNLENFYLSTGFELNFKATLIEKGVLVHEINKKQFPALYKKQRTEPVFTHELFAVAAYEYDSTKQKNFLQGIGGKTLNFSIICEKLPYLAVLGKPSQIINIANEYREQRNHIHLPGDFSETPFLSTLSSDQLMTLLVDFINQDIVDKSNTLALHPNFVHWQRLQHLINP